MTIENPGPIQMLTLGFPGNMFKGEILPELDRLKGEGIVRVIDMMIVRKDPQGHLLVATSSDLDFDEATALGSYFGALAGFAAEGPAGIDRGSIAGAAELADGHVFDEDDAFRVGEALKPDTTAVAILVEHLWARDLLEAVERAHGVELMNEWIQPENVLTISHMTQRTEVSEPRSTAEPDGEQDADD